MSAARPSSEDEEFRSVHAIRNAIPTRAHAEMLFGMVAELLGESAWVESWNGETTRTLFRREEPGSRWIVPWPLLSVTRGGREGPSPIRTAVPGVYEEPKPRAGHAPKIRGLGPGELTLHDGPQHVTICYGGDGRWFECSVSSPPQDALAGVVAALAAKSASPPEMVASFVAGLDLKRHGPGRVHLPVALPGGTEGVWRCGLAAFRETLVLGRVPDGARWVAVDGWTGRAIAFGARHSCSSHFVWTMPSRRMGIVPHDDSAGRRAVVRSRSPIRFPSPASRPTARTSPGRPAPSRGQRAADRGPRPSRRRRR